jgi:site-specific DNA-methyltransferase (adenine-specific)
MGVAMANNAPALDAVRRGLHLPASVPHDLVLPFAPDVTAFYAWQGDKLYSHPYALGHVPGNVAVSGGLAAQTYQRMGLRVVLGPVNAGDLDQDWPALPFEHTPKPAKQVVLIHKEGPAFERPIGQGVDYIWHCDALTLMRALLDNSVDMIFIDPPYNMTELDFEQSIDWAAFWSEARRILKSKKSPVLSFSQQPFTTDLINSNRKGFRFEIVIEKSMPVGYLDAKRRPLRCHENLLIFADAMPDYWPVMSRTDNRRASVHERGGMSDHYNEHHRMTTWTDDGTRYPRDVWKYAQRNTSFANTKTWHPTEKPLQAVEDAIEMFSRPDWLIVDCFCGSGPVAIIASKLKRHFICGDNGTDERTGQPWAVVARTRLAQTDPYQTRTMGAGVSQPSLFAPEVAAR